MHKPLNEARGEGDPAKENLPVPAGHVAPKVWGVEFAPRPRAVYAAGGIGGTAVLALLAVLAAMDGAFLVTFFPLAILAFLTTSFVRQALAGSENVPKQIGNDVNSVRATRLAAVLSTAGRPMTVEALAKTLTWTSEAVVSGLRVLENDGRLFEDLDLDSGHWVYRLEGAPSTQKDVQVHSLEERIAQAVQAAETTGVPHRVEQEETAPAHAAQPAEYSR